VGNNVTTKPKKSAATPKAVAGVRALRRRLAEDVPDYAEAVRFEREAEAFCLSLRAELRKRRKAKHLDQEALGERIGLTQSAVSRIERSQGDIGLKSLYRYARALGLQPVISFTPSVEELLDEVTGAPDEAGQLGQQLLLQAAAHFTGEQAKMMQSLSEDVAELVTRLADAAKTVRTP